MFQSPKVMKGQAGKKKKRSASIGRRSGKRARRRARYTASGGSAAKKPRSKRRLDGSWADFVQDFGIENFADSQEDAHCQGQPRRGPEPNLLKDISERQYRRRLEGPSAMLRAAMGEATKAEQAKFIDKLVSRLGLWPQLLARKDKAIQEIIDKIMEDAQGSDEQMDALMAYIFRSSSGNLKCRANEANLNAVEIFGKIPNSMEVPSEDEEAV